MTDKIEMKFPYMKLSDIPEDATFCFPDIRKEWQRSMVNHMARIYEMEAMNLFSRINTQHKEKKMKFRPEFNEVEKDEKIGVGASFKTHGINWIIVENSPSDDIHTKTITLLNAETFSVMDRYIVVNDPNWISEQEFSNLYLEAFKMFPPLDYLEFENTIYEEQ